jgi:hypothetical protein
MQARRAPPAGDVVTIAALEAAAGEALASVVADSAVIALHQTARMIDIEVRAPLPLTRVQQRQIARALRGIASKTRWRSTTTVRIALPLAIPHGAPLAVCVPVFRQGHATIWWPLSTAPHMLLAGDAWHTLAVMVVALRALADIGYPLTIALHDPLDELHDRPLPRLSATPDALATTRLRALRAAWAAQRGEAVDSEPPLVLVVAAPDEIVWRDLAPLLATPTAGVSVLVLLADGAIAEARDACHNAPVIEIGGRGVTPLPESHRPPGTVSPVAGAALVWRPGVGVTRGTPLCNIESALAEWLPEQSAAV